MRTATGICSPLRLIPHQLFAERDNGSPSSEDDCVRCVSWVLLAYTLIAAGRPYTAWRCTSCVGGLTLCGFVVLIPFLLRS